MLNLYAEKQVKQLVNDAAVLFLYVYVYMCWCVFEQVDMFACLYIVKLCLYACVFFHQYISCVFKVAMFHILFTLLVTDSYLIGEKMSELNKFALKFSLGKIKSLVKNLVTFPRFYVFH